MSHPHEAHRRVLERYALDDTKAPFDRIVRMVGQMLDVPVATFGVLDGDRCRLKAAIGIEDESVPTATSFAARVVDAGEPLVVHDPETPFAEGATVASKETPRVYAGVPLVIEASGDGTDGTIAIGALCALDVELSLSEAEVLARLESLGATAVDALELRARRVQEEFPARHREFVEDITDAFFALDAEWQFIYVNRRAETLTERSREELLGQNIWDAFPEAVGSMFYEQYHKAQRDQTTVSFEAYYEPLGTWFRVKTYPIERGLAIYFDDITARKEAEAELQRRKRQFQILFERNPLPMWVYDRDTLDFLAVNHAAVAHYGYDRDDFLSMRITDIRPPAGANKLIEYLRRERPAFRHAGHWKHEQADGTVIDVKVTSSEIVFGGHKAVLVVAQDVTKQRIAEAAVRERERYLSVMLDSIGDAVIATDADGRVVRMNGIAETLTGWREDEAAGRPLVDVFHIINARTGEPVESPVAKVLRHGHIVGLANHTALLARDGTRYQIADSAAPIQAEGGDMLGVVMVFRDVTEAYERREALRRSNTALEEAQEIARTGNLEVDLIERTFTLSDEAGRILGLERHKTYPIRTFFELIHPGDRERVQATFQEMAEIEVSEATDYRILRDDGMRVEERWVRGRGRTVYADDGRAIGYFETITDITDRKQIEEQLRAQEQMYRELVQTTSAILWRGDPETFAFTYISPQAEALLGYTPEEWMGDPDFWKGHMHPEDREWAPAYCEHAIKEQRRHSFDYRMIAADGRTVWLRDIVNVVTEDGGPAELVGVMIDVTELKETEAELRVQERKVAALYRAMRDLTKAPDYGTVAEEIEELVTDTLAYPVVAVRFVKEGRSIPVRVSEGTIRHMGGERPAYDIDGESLLARLYRAGEVVIYDDVQEAEPTFDGGDVRSMAYVPIGDLGSISVADVEAGALDPFDVQLLEILARNAESVLERIEREEVLREARDRAEEMSRLKSSFLANMSHEIRTPLTSIIGFSEVLGEQDLGSANKLTKLIHRSGQRLLETLNSVLDLSQLEAGSMELAPQRVDVATEIRDAAELFMPQAREKDVPIAVHAPDEPVKARFDTAALRRILSNLLGNAVKFTPAGGRIDVRLRPVEDRLCIEVEDTGVGIDDAFLPDLFEAFKQESTGNARVFEGSGLGLTITRQLVHLMGGTIEVASEKDKGTCFTVELPREGRRDE